MAARRCSAWRPRGPARRRRGRRSPASRRMRALARVVGEPVDAPGSAWKCHPSQKIASPGRSGRCSVSTKSGLRCRAATCGSSATSRPPPTVIVQRGCPFGPAMLLDVRAERSRERVRAAPRGTSARCCVSGSKAGCASSVTVHGHARGRRLARRTAPAEQDRPRGAARRPSRGDVLLRPGPGERQQAPVAGRPSLVLRTGSRGRPRRPGAGLRRSGRGRPARRGSRCRRARCRAEAGSPSWVGDRRRRVDDPLEREVVGSAAEVLAQPELTAADRLGTAKLVAERRSAAAAGRRRPSVARRARQRDPTRCPPSVALR